MLTPEQESDLCALLAGAFESGKSGIDLLAAADRLQDDGHPLAEFLKAWHARPGRPGRPGWVIGSARIGERVTVRVSAVEAAGEGFAECELMIESPDHRRAQVWIADIPAAVARALVALWPEGDRRESRVRVERLATLPGGWRAAAAATGRAVLGASGA